MNYTDTRVWLLSQFSLHYFKNLFDLVLVLSVRGHLFSWYSSHQNKIISCLGTNK